MSVLEIILYSLLGGGTLAYVIYVIVKAVKIKKGTWKKNPRKEEEDD